MGREGTLRDAKRQSKINLSHGLWVSLPVRASSLRYWEKSGHAVHRGACTDKNLLRTCMCESCLPSKEWAKVSNEREHTCVVCDLSSVPKPPASSALQRSTMMGFDLCIKFLSTNGRGRGPQISVGDSQPLITIASIDLIWMNLGPKITLRQEMSLRNNEHGGRALWIFWIIIIKAGRGLG